MCFAAKLVLGMIGFDIQIGKITDANGDVAHLSSVASWGFPKLMGHWKRKHLQVVFVPCCNKNELGHATNHFCNCTALGAGTEFELLLRSFTRRTVYNDLGIKLKEASSAKPTAKICVFRCYLILLQSACSILMCVLEVVCRLLLSQVLILDLSS